FPNLGDEDHEHGAEPSSATHLPGHARFDLGMGKRFGKNWSVTVNVLNVTNGSYLLDNSPLLGGTHWVEPRQIWAEVRYMFNYKGSLFMTTETPWLVSQKPNRSANVRLFCLPYAGGGASIFGSWQKNFSDTVEVCPVQLPGRGLRIEEPSFTEMNELVRIAGQALA